VEIGIEQTTSIVRVAMLFLIGIIVLSGIDNGVDHGDYIESITLTMTMNPADGDTVTIDNNIFEFDIGDGVTVGNIPVTIDAYLVNTVLNLKNAMQIAGCVIQ
jgi:hypothetical protein